MQDYCLALTGGIACGKSTVGDMLCRSGLARVDADVIARQVVEPGSSGLALVIDYFGEEFLTESGQLDRSRLGSRIFQKEEDRKALEAILHPQIWFRLKGMMDEASLKRRPTVFEIPLLFEKGHQVYFSTVWVVAATREKQVQRLCARNDLSLEEANKRIEAQMNIEEKIALASFVVFNDGDIKDLEDQVRIGLAKWRQFKES